MGTHYDTIRDAIRLAATIADPMFHEELVQWDEDPEWKHGDRHVVLRTVSEVDEDSQPVRIETQVGNALQVCLAQRAIVAVDVRVETVHATEMPHLTFARALKTAMWAAEVKQMMAAAESPCVLLGEAGQMLNRSSVVEGVALPQSSFELRFRAQVVTLRDPTPVGLIDSIVAEGSVDDGNPTPFEITTTATRP